MSARPFDRCLWALSVAESVELEGRVIPAGRLYFQVDHRRQEGAAAPPPAAHP